MQEPGVARDRGAQPGGLGRSGHVDRERVAAELERQVRRAEEREQLAIDRPLGADQLEEAVCLGRRERELDDRAGDVPRHVLAAGQVVAGVVITAPKLDPKSPIAASSAPILRMPIARRGSGAAARAARAASRR